MMGVNTKAAEHAAEEDDRRRRARWDPEHVGVEECEERDEGLEDQVGRQIAQAVADLFRDGQFFCAYAHLMLPLSFVGSPAGRINVLLPSSQ